MKKVLFAIISLYNGGAEKSLVNLLNELPNDKYQVDLLLLKKEGIFIKQVPSWVNILDTPEEIKSLYAPITNVGKHTFLKFLGTVISYFVENKPGERVGLRWKKFYSPQIKPLEQKYDVAIAYVSGEILYLVGDKINAQKKIAWIHSDYRSAGFPKKYDYLYLKDMDEIVTISEQCLQVLKEEFPDLSQKMHCIPNITSSNIVSKLAEEFYPNEYSKDRTILLSIGRLEKPKAIDKAIKAASILKQKGIQFEWFVIGDGKLERKLKRLIIEYDVENCFKLLGVRENPYPYIKNCTLFVQTSIYEGKSVVLDEAKILSKPIVVTAYPTVKDQIVDGKEGIVVEMSSEAIAEGVMQVLENQNIRETLCTYLSGHEYGNEQEVEKYIYAIEGDL